MIQVNDENLLEQASHFAFGKNWLDYANKIDEPKIEQAVSDLRRLAGEETLEGLTFLDIGCGSGLHALAALRLNASNVTGVDIDADSVDAARWTFARFAPDAASRFEVQSVFDMTADAFGTFDIVYSWGVLHHTGDMQRAIECAARLVKPGGEFWVALYRKTPFCGTWRGIKRWYSHATPAGQARARRFYMRMQRTMMRLRGDNYDAYVAGYGKGRGMDYYNDVHDWLGGYPYESIAPDECRALMTRLGFAVKREFVATPGRFLPGLLGSGCDEYVFRRVGPT